MTPELRAALAQVPVWAIDDIGWRTLHASILAAQSPGERRAVASMSIEQGVATIPVEGVLMPRSNIFAEFFGAVSCEAIGAQLRAAAQNPDVTAIHLVFDSPGGDVAGVPELADAIFGLRGQKRTVAHVRYAAASGAYWLASQCDEVWSEPSGDVGSIGVFTVHEDWSGMLDQMGVDVTLIRAGKHKAEWAPYGPLSDDAKEHAQGEVNAIYKQFLGAVARGRGVDAATVKDTYGQGRTLRAKDAKAAGMIDRIATLTDLEASAGGRRRGARADDEPVEEPTAPDAGQVQRDIDLLTL